MYKVGDNMRVQQMYEGDMTTKEISLDSLTDQQKTLLSQVSYLNISQEGCELAANGGVSLYELRDYLANPDTIFCGDMGMGGVASWASNIIVGSDVPTDAQLLDQLIDAGLGDFKITNIYDEQGTLGSGFQAMAFEDSAGNVGISYRGSDLDLTKGALRDWIEADFLEYFTGTSTQVDQALSYFEQNKSVDGNNYLYGHSLGGNLASHVLLDKHSEIQEAFVINANPINQKLIDTPEKKAAFNDPEKYSFNMICGDVVSNLKSTNAYAQNVNYIKNDNRFANNLIGSHLVQSAAFDKDGQFIKTTRGEMIQSLGALDLCLSGTTQIVREAINVQETVSDYKKDVMRNIGQGIEAVANYAKDGVGNIGEGLGQFSEKAAGAMSAAKDINLDDLFDVDINSLFDVDINDLFQAPSIDIDSPVIDTMDRVVDNIYEMVDMER
jgi:hypothetical protein